MRLAAYVVSKSVIEFLRGQQALMLHCVEQSIESEQQPLKLQVGRIHRLLFLARAGFVLFARSIRQLFRWRDVRHDRFKLILPARNDVALSIHHGFKARLCDVRRIIFAGLSHLCIGKTGPVEKLGFCRARHKTGHRYPAILQLVAQSIGEGVYEGLGAVINGLKRSGCEAGN